MGKFYKLILSSEPEVIGVKNGIQQVEIIREGFSDPVLFDNLYGYYGPSEYWNRGEFEIPPAFLIQGVKPLEGTILTDFLSYGPILMSCHFMISERVVDCFKLFNIQKYYLHKASLDALEEKQSYNLFCCRPLGYSYIDFSRSRFYSGNELAGKTYFEFKCEDDYESFKAQSINIRAEKLSFSKIFDTTLDLFIPRFGGIFVSGELKSAFEEGGLTGVKFLEVDSEYDGKNLSLKNIR